MTSSSLHMINLTSAMRGLITQLHSGATFGRYYCEACSILDNASVKKKKLGLERNMHKNIVRGRGSFDR